jgi:hypothetical protein
MRWCIMFVFSLLCTRIYLKWKFWIVFSTRTGSPVEQTVELTILKKSYYRKISFFCDVLALSSVLSYCAFLCVLPLTFTYQFIHITHLLLKMKNLKWIEPCFLGSVSGNCKHYTMSTVLKMGFELAIIIKVLLWQWLLHLFSTVTLFLKLFRLHSFWLQWLIIYWGFCLYQCSEPRWTSYTTCRWAFPLVVPYQTLYKIKSPLHWNHRL